MLDTTINPIAKSSLNIKRLILLALRIPALYILIGLGFLAFSYIDDFFAIKNPHWIKWFNVTEKTGNIFIAVSIATFIYNFICLLCKQTELRLAQNYQISSVILASIRRGLRVIYALVVINIIISMIGPKASYLALADNVMNVALISAIGWVAIQVLYTCEAVVNQYMTGSNRYDNRTKTLYTKMHIIRNIATVLIIILTIAAILMSFSSVRDIGISLLASAGFLTAIVGLAAQKALFSVFSGLQIALSQQLKIGDMVVVDREPGIIEEITFTYVTLKISDQRRLIVPISYFVDKSFENRSREAGMLSSLHLFVDYTTPIQLLRDELNNILKASKYWDKKAAKLQVAELKENCVDVVMQVSAENPEDLGNLQAEVREKMLEFLRTRLSDNLPKTRSIQYAAEIS